MEVNDDAGNLTPRGALRFFASKLAPTEPFANIVDGQKSLYELPQAAIF
ncbi:UNVERIFIED_ORG: hypothetical protein J2Y84_002930 [Pseudomonas reinekei]|nr:hypothetical protein [Pseudomonas reinekei]